MKLKVNPPYIPLVQQPLCCFACSVQWVLLRRNLKLIDQEEIAQYFGLEIPKKSVKYFTRKIKVTSNRKNYGTKSEKQYNNMNRFFAKYKIPLKAKSFRVSKVNDPQLLISENIKKGNDIITIYHQRGIDKRRYNIGHVVVIAEIDGDMAIVGDPSRTSPKFWRVKLRKLVNAMSDRFDGDERGFIVISKK